MSHSIEDNRSAYHKAQEIRRNEQHNIVQEVEKNFEADGFVKVHDAYYNKAYYNKHQVVSVSFKYDSIHVRFSTGDIVSVNEEQLLALTS